MGRRPDGYHLLSMLNSWLSFGDELLIEPSQGSRIDVQLNMGAAFAAENDIGPLEENLVYKAAHAFKARFAPELACKIRLTKSIPTGAGLAGGSSDGAATLLGLALICGLADVEDFNNAELGWLNSLALELGADLPYFLRGGLCRVEGVGEKVATLDLPYLPQSHLILVLPSVKSATPAVYEEFRAQTAHTQFAVDGKLERFCARLGHSAQPGYEELLGLLENDLCAAAFKLQPKLAELHDKLAGIKGYVCGMSGSGSAFYLLPNSLRRVDGAELGIIRDSLKNLANQVILSTFLPKNTTRVECVAKGSA